MYSLLVAHERYTRLLERLLSVPVHLLSVCAIGRDFVARSASDSRCGAVVRYVLPEDSAIFEPVLIGAVKSVHYTDSGAARVILTTPPHATHDVDVFYWNQVACLSTAAVQQIRSASYIGQARVFDGMHNWTLGPTAEVAYIFLDLDPATKVERSTPARCCRTFGLSHTQYSSTSSSSSSSTLSSTDLPPPASIYVEEGDIVVAKCRLHCREQLQSSALLRVFGVRATHVEVLV
ncbi:hypothetical protein C8R47DRAFT_1080540 [Mycena vitilis]|nr:hypothetical protein C8R47DRAFT_1080540 [Mycena vitilis]